jgi:hypothetical protein
MVADQNRHQDDVAPAEEGGEEDQGPHGGQEEESGEKAELLRTNQNGPKPVSAGTVSIQSKGHFRRKLSLN